MADRPSQTYYCQNLGCSNGHGSPFSKAPEEWFRSRGLPLPKNCPDCRSWMDEQQDEAVRCGECRSPIRVSARYKISQHKKVRRYVPPGKCGLCERGVKPQRSVAKKSPKREREKKVKDKRQKLFSDLPLRDLEPREMITDLSAYQRTVVERLGPGNRIQVTRQVHLERHLESSPHSLTDPVVARAHGLDDPKSPSSLVGSQAEVAELLSNVAAFALSTDTDMIREYIQPGERERKDRIIRVTFTGSHDGLEISVLEPQSDTSYRLVSSYDKESVGTVLRQIGKSWR